jgi:hypothetical protein
MSATISSGPHQDFISMPHKVFYSWQSDLPNSTNRGFIQTALDTAVKSLQGDGSIVIDRDTMGVGGSPDIAQTIFQKIQDSQVFICDVSIINRQYVDDIENLRALKNAGSNYALRLTPNPNVLIELGYALALLGPERVIMLMNQEFGGIDLLPFDLRMRRVVPYSMPFENSERAPERNKLAQQILRGLQTILEGFDGKMPGEIVLPVDDEIHSLISKVQSRSVPLSQSIADALSIVKKMGDDNLMDFCKGELSGWEGQMTVPDDVLGCRSVEVFLTSHEIDTDIGRGNNVDNVWRYMENNTEIFKKKTLIIDSPISYCESFEVEKVQYLLVIRDQLGNYDSDTDNPNNPVNLYFRKTAYQDIVERVRVEFTKRLLKLLESHAKGMLSP